MGDVIVRVVDLPTHRIGCTTVEDENGDYNIYVNARYGHNGQLKAYKHDCCHIEHDDFRSDLPVEICEELARQAAEE